MNAGFVQVAIPVLRGKRRFHLDKGRAWSVVEHLVLAALAQQALTAGQLADAGDNLPRRLVIEIIIRLMRAGWVELSQGPKGTIFKASPAGMAAATLTELPNTPKRIAAG